VHLRIVIIDPEREKAGNGFSQAPFQLIVEFFAPPRGNRKSTPLAKWACGFFSLSHQACGQLS
jgi:hypothetical protein